MVMIQSQRNMSGKFVMIGDDVYQYVGKFNGKYKHTYDNMKPIEEPIEKPIEPVLRSVKDVHGDSIQCYVSQDKEAYDLEGNNIGYINEYNYLNRAPTKRRVEITKPINQHQPIQNATADTEASLRSVKDGDGKLIDLYVDTNRIAYYDYEVDSIEVGKVNDKNELVSCCDPFLTFILEYYHLNQTDEPANRYPLSEFRRDYKEWILKRYERYNLKSHRDDILYPNLARIKSMIGASPLMIRYDDRGQRDCYFKIRRCVIGVQRKR